MAIRKIDNKWYVDIRIGRKRKRLKSPEDSKVGAQAFETQIRHKLAKGEDPLEKKHVPAEPKTFKDFSEKWFSIYVINNNRMSEIKGKESILKKHLLPFFGTTKLDKMTSLQIEEYKNQKLKKGLSRKTVNNHLLTLSSCMHKAQEWQEVKNLPKFKKLKLPPQKFDFISLEESRLLLQNAEGIWHDMILLGLRSGMRLGELRGLRWEDLNFDKRVIAVRRSIYKSNNIVPPKSNKERYLPMNDELYEMFKQRQEKVGFIFSCKSGLNIRNEHCRRSLHKICDKAGLRRIGWHVLRHTFASHLVMCGVSLKAVQELLGHADMSTTLRYAHLAPSALKDAVDLLELIDSKADIVNYGQYAGSEYEVMLIGGSGNKIILPKTKQKPA
jgi:integrase